VADFYEPIYQEEYKGPYQFQAKDLWLIDKSDGCLLLIDDEYPGSVEYFRQKAQADENYPIYTITPFDLEDVVLEMQMEDPAYWNDFS
ncbi:MAG TPA: SLOG family protein, partial [Bacillota bacterium]|nr:SLOG family protein [Bacillota bacterium]